MKRVVLLLILFIFIFIFYVSIKKNYLGGNGMYSEKGSNYEILVNYPVSGYRKLDNTVINKLNNYIDNFKNDISNNDINVNWKYDLIINYKSFNYKNYISYVFFIEYFTGGAHPNHLICTVNYDTIYDKFVTIEDLVKYNNNILNIFSKISRNELMHNKDIVDISMLMEGTMPNTLNFSNFVLSNDGIIIYFSYYQVAPYSSGMFNVLINYKYL